MISSSFACLPCRAVSVYVDGALGACAYDRPGAKRRLVHTSEESRVEVVVMSRAKTNIKSTPNSKNTTREPLSEDSEALSYVNPLTSRYSSKAMSQLFSSHHKAEIWRELWIVLAEEEKKLGVPISTAQIKEMKAAAKDIDLGRVRELEKQLRHDVMSHIKAFGERAPGAEGVIHLGATSCYVTDNADVLIQREALELIRDKLVVLLSELKTWMKEWKGEVTSGFTHFQIAQPVTVGKRIALWAQDILWDAQEIEYVLGRLRPLGCKGATGTQASFLTLFNGDAKKVQELDVAICKRLGFDGPVRLSGQTLSRKIDCWLMNALSNLSASFSKMSQDLRLLQHLGEMREPFGKKQVGSSAMAYKRNPVLAERMSSLSRLAMNFAHNASWTHATQWLERSLDDSANRRVSLPEAFLCVDALCELAMRVVKEIEVDTDVIRQRLKDNAALFETETTMMKGTLKGGSRQDLHEGIRKRVARSKSIKTSSSSSNDESLRAGLAPVQVDQFIVKELQVYLKGRSSSLKKAKFGTDSI